MLTLTIVSFSISINTPNQRINFIVNSLVGSGYFNDCQFLNWCKVLPTLQLISDNNNTKNNQISFL
ncbi:hypothetical protein BJP34_14840 [Moorena producens PAL-8-15-08-1]|uniref:Uncharacterized protein n=1 Tax=Moorena producens PAL-8-15-08-1 TaxID=1458985 RepID=A0A1D8TSA8_9CYAN|nr:hypothetical protein BJP34_14840 [Moorena producens PAL-8-15-08-1]